MVISAVPGELINSVMDGRLFSFKYTWQENHGNPYYEPTIMVHVRLFTSVVPGQDHKTAATSYFRVYSSWSILL